MKFRYETENHLLKCLLCQKNNFFKAINIFYSERKSKIYKNDIYIDIYFILNKNQNSV